MHTAVIVQADLVSKDNNDLNELVQLVCAAGAEPIETLRCSRVAPDVKYYLGHGKVDQLVSLVKASCASLVVFNNELSPSQQRNLEKVTHVSVIDRTELILDIFAQRAQTFEGKLQVELAQLQRLSTRLIRGWTHLERQKGGIGLRGPGETQLETDRRLIRQRIRLITQKLEKVQRQRAQGRRSRVRTGVQTVALVGYTNVGKSTLFNQLTASDVCAKDQLFATLDPTVRQLVLPGFGAAVLADTVGFIKGLPHQLVVAFRATLEEVVQADLIVHVVDAADPDSMQHQQKVHEVLQEIGAETVPSMLVNNKIDLLPSHLREARVDRDAHGIVERVWISVQEQLGLDMLLGAIGERLSGGMVHCCIKLSPQAMALRAQLYQLQSVVAEAIDEQGDCLLEIKLPQQLLHHLRVC